jgi:hypothetical protein
MLARLRVVGGGGEWIGGPVLEQGGARRAGLGAEQAGQLPDGGLDDGRLAILRPLRGGTPTKPNSAAWPDAVLASWISTSGPRLLWAVPESPASRQKGRS